MENLNISQRCQNCINELKLPSNKRDLNKIIKYLHTLQPFMNLIKDQNMNYENIILQTSKIMKYQYNNKNDIVIHYGDKGEKFFIILRGKVNIFVPVLKEYYMSENDFILYLLNLKNNKQNELISQCLKLNVVNFSIPYEKFDEFLYDLVFKKTKGGIYLDKREILDMAKKIYNHTLNDSYRNYLQNISPNEYILLTKVSNAVIENTNNINYYHRIINKRNLSKEIKQKKVRIPIYELINTFQEGDTFGELALENESNNKRQATIIAIENCDLAVVDKIEYNSLIKDSVIKSKNKFFNLINTYRIFDDIGYNTFNKKYYPLFRYVRINNDNLILKENHKCDSVYFLISGECELYVDKNICEANDLIHKLSQVLSGLRNKNNKFKENQKKYFHSAFDEDIVNNHKTIFNMKKNQINLSKKINLKEIDIDKMNNVLIDNNDYINNKKFHSEFFNKMILTKKRIKLGVYNLKQIIGLNDLVNSNENGINSNTSIVNCRCSSMNCEMYKIEYKNFINIYENEPSVKKYTNELLIQSICCIIQRLILHKYIIHKKIIQKDKNNKNNFNKSSISNINLRKGIEKSKKIIEFNKKINGKTIISILNSLPHKSNKRNKYRNIKYIPINNITTNENNFLTQKNKITNVNKNKKKIFYMSSTNFDFYKNLFSISTFYKKYCRQIKSKTIDNKINMNTISTVSNNSKTIISKTNSRNRKIDIFTKNNSSEEDSITYFNYYIDDGNNIREIKVNVDECEKNEILKFNNFKSKKDKLYYKTLPRNKTSFRKLKIKLPSFKKYMQSHKNLSLKK